MIKSKLKNRNLSQEDAFNLSELFKLMKPRVMSLVIFTCAVGLLMAPNIIPTRGCNNWNYFSFNWSGRCWCFKHVV